MEDKLNFKKNLANEEEYFIYHLKSKGAFEVMQNSFLVQHVVCSILFEGKRKRYILPKYISCINPKRSCCTCEINLYQRKKHRIITRKNTVSLEQLLERLKIKNKVTKK